MDYWIFLIHNANQDDIADTFDLFSPALHLWSFNCNCFLVVGEVKMKIAITNNETTILTIKDYNDLNFGLIGQVITEMEIIKAELIEKYENMKDKNKQVEYD